MRNDPLKHEPAGPIHPILWSRIIIGAVLLEMALVAIAAPLVSLVENPFVAGDQRTADNFAIFFGSIAFACFAVGGLLGAWVARPLSSAFVVNGALTGIVATVIYFAICSIPPNTIAGVLAAYGAPWFFVSNALRIVGCMSGAACMRRWQ